MCREAEQPRGAPHGLPCSLFELACKLLPPVCNRKDDRWPAEAKVAHLLAQRNLPRSLGELDYKFLLPVRLSCSRNDERRPAEEKAAQLMVEGKLRSSVSDLDDKFLLPARLSCCRDDECLAAKSKVAQVVVE